MDDRGVVEVVSVIASKVVEVGVPEDVMGDCLK